MIYLVVLAAVSVKELGKEAIMAFKTSRISKRNSRGQAMIEYLLILVMIASVSFTLFEYVFDYVFKPAVGSGALSNKMTECLSTGDAYGGC